MDWRKLMASAISIKLKPAWFASLVSNASFETLRRSAGAAIPSCNIFSQKVSVYVVLRKGSTCSTSACIGSSLRAAWSMMESERPTLRMQHPGDLEPHGAHV